MFSKKTLTMTILVILSMLILSCSNHEGSSDDIGKTTKNIVNNGMESDANANDEEDSAIDDNEEVESLTENSNKLNKSVNKEFIKVSIFGDETLSIEKDRFNDGIYGTGQLDNRWNLNEIDVILNSIKGDWRIDEYVGFLDSSIYYPELFDSNNSIGESLRNKLMDDYTKRIEDSKSNIPNLAFSVRKYGGKDSSSNYLIVKDTYLSPISIVLSVDRIYENYPVFVDQTTISMDFVVEYPVIYIKFFMKDNEDGSDVKYKPATLVLSKDNHFYVLVDGAFYSVVSRWVNEIYTIECNCSIGYKTTGNIITITLAT